MAVMVTGGARSGKSLFAEAYCMRVAERGVYIATCLAHDEEMRERIALHREQRAAAGFAWETVEESVNVPQLLNRLSDGFGRSEGPAPVLLVDCLTLWLTNVMLAEEDNAAGGSVEKAANELALAVAAYPYPLVLVTNEVGSGIVPAYPLGRRFRDEAGRLNRRIAEICDRVFLVTAGIPLELKSAAFRWEDL